MEPLAQNAQALWIRLMIFLRKIVLQAARVLFCVVFMKLYIGYPMLCPILTLVFPVLMVVIGLLFWHDCPAEPAIPVHLAVTGGITLTTLILLFCNGRHQRIVHITAILYNLCIVSTLVGLVWINRTMATFSRNREDSNFCHPSLYGDFFELWSEVYIATVLPFHVIVCAVCSSLDVNVWRGQADEVLG